MITVTERAAKKALVLAQRDGKQPVLRVGVRGGGCSGLSYYIDFDEGPRDDDQRLEIAGLTIVVDPKSLKFLEGTELDYDTNLLKGGFRFNNPLAKRSCGCGESFSVT
jgi:iron-sulfur cluster assembly protein